MLSQEQLHGILTVDTENLLTLAVAMSKTQEKDWLDGYESIGSVSPLLRACRLKEGVHNMLRPQLSTIRFSDKGNRL